MTDLADLQTLKREVAAITWWHTIDLGKGIVTPGLDPTPARLPEIRLPEDLAGLSVLDIGAWDGFFSFEAERRGARRVLATDSFCWGQGGWGTKAGFELARRALRSKVEDSDIDPLELSPEKIGTFDLVLCLGVLYHMRHPLLALERVASVTRGRLILQTQVDLAGLTRPAIAFYQGSELHNDPTNWCGPNPAAVVAMLRTVGFGDVEVVSQWFAEDVSLARMNGAPVRGHITVHATK
ncbi:MAG: class I SAM-dependent methyltransferase [Vicinamibacterales bacterium]